MSRRDFLVLTAATAAATALSSKAGLSQTALTGREQPGRRFTRMFDLPPFADATPRVQAALMEMGAPGGLMDARDPLSEGPVRLITNPELSPANRDNPALTAGVTFVGQFIDHDLTFDTSSPLGTPFDPERSPNGRTPFFDLDSVYGGGPASHPQLFDPDDMAKFRIESGGLFEDLPRGTDLRAIIPDPRNDENLILAGLHCAILQFHNRVVDRLRANGDDRRTADEDEDADSDQDAPRLRERADDDRRRRVFVEAQRLVRWHYQWIVVHEFLRQVVGSALVDDVLVNGARCYRPRRGRVDMPVEFQGAAYRFGHSLVRPSYRANLAGDHGQPFFAFVFDPRAEGQLDPVDLRGGTRSSRRFVGWQTFFNFGDAQAQHVRPNKTIDTRISTPLFNLPLGAIATGDRPTALPQRNLLRHLTWSLPSGQEVAKAMRIPPLASSELKELATFGVGLERSTPLWYYVLKEAELNGGASLAGVGARIVAEVIIELLRSNRASYLARNPRWRPTLPSRTSGTFGMVDLLTFAGVDPDSRRQ